MAASDLHFVRRIFTTLSPTQLKYTEPFGAWNWYSDTTGSGEVLKDILLKIDT